jgi:hypothetical protein
MIQHSTSGHKPADVVPLRQDVERISVVWVDGAARRPYRDLVEMVALIRSSSV